MQALASFSLESSSYSNLAFSNGGVILDPTYWFTNHYLQVCEFIAQFLTAIKTRVNCWLEECTSKPSRCNVNDELLNFVNIQRMIKTRQFSFSLLPAVRRHTSKQPRANHNYHNNIRYDRPAKRSPVHNQNRVSPWKLK